MSGNAAERIEQDGRLPPTTAAAGSEMRWFAVNTHPNSEGRAQTNLERQGWTCFCPVIDKTIRSGRRLLTQARPLFPGYLFVSLDPLHARWRAVDSSFGVRALVKSGEAPAAMPVGCVETLMAMADERGRVSFTSTLREGEDVTFMAGPFAGLMGRLHHLDAQGRVTVLLDLLGRATTIRGNARDLRPCVITPKSA